MKRGKKLIIMLAVLVVLLGATAAAARWNPENSVEEEEDTTAVVFSLDPEAVTALGWDYSAALSFEKTEEGWEYTQDAAFTVDTDYIDAMLSALTEIVSYKTIENVENWDQYGLEIPVCTITVTSDQTDTLCIGQETGVGGQRYFSIGDGNAYLVDADLIDRFSYGLYDVLRYESVPAMQNIASLEVETASESYVITCQENSGLAYSDEYVWFMGDKALDTDLTEDLIQNIISLTWNECVNYNADELSDYGLDAPTAVVTVNYAEAVAVSTNETDENGNVVYETRYDDASFTLEIGGSVGSYYYARIAGSNMVYTIPGTMAEEMIYTSYYDLQPDEVLSLDWENVTAMDITLNGEIYTLQKETKQVTDEEGNVSEETVYTLNGEETDISDITSALDALEFAGYASGMTPERGEEIRFVFYRDRETFPEVELVLYQYDSSTCMTTLNGEATVFAARADVVTLIEAVNAVVLD